MSSFKGTAWEEDSVEGGERHSSILTEGGKPSSSRPKVNSRNLPETIQMQQCKLRPVLSKQLGEGYQVHLTKRFCIAQSASAPS